MPFKFASFASLATLFLIGLFFFFFGTFVILLSWSTVLQQETIHWILEKPLFLAGVGVILAYIGIAIAYYTFSCTRRHTIYLWTGPLAAAVDENVIYQYVEQYWQSRFPDTTIPFRITFKKYGLRVAAEFPPRPVEEQKELIQQIKEDFQDLFGRVIGYPYDVQIAAHFPS